MDTAKVLMIGDISGDAGMGALFLSLSSIVRRRDVDLVVVNGENASGGFGLTAQDYEKQKSEILPLLDSEQVLLRPLNYPRGVPGHGSAVVTKNGVRFAVINAQGRHDLVIADCPFRRVRDEADRLFRQGCIVLVDFHAENAQEKEALAFHLDGIASALVGTHTHVQTMDEKILPGGCAYITDIGMTGVQGQVIGSDPQIAIQRQLTQIPLKSEVAQGRGEIRGVLITIDKSSRKAVSIERI